MNTFWKNKKVLITGGTGFIGSHVVEKLLEQGAIVRIIDNLQTGKKKNISLLEGKVEFIEGDCSLPADALQACKGQDVVLNLAARVGGIEYNRTHQATMLKENLDVASTVIEAARLASVERFLVVSSACVYPHDALVPTPESEGFRGEPEATNGGYGWAKRMAEKLGMYYAEQFGMKVSIVRPYNAYGPRDHFDPQTSHVIAAIIKRVFDGENPLVVWGTGKQTRAFLYVEDLAEGMIQAVERYPVADPVNLGTNEEVSIAQLVEKIVKLSGKNIPIQFDTTKPDGSPRRNSDNTKVKEKVGFVAKHTLDEGLANTIAWYRQEHGF
jgi:GDP-L-fucose synthase